MGSARVEDLETVCGEVGVSVLWGGVRVKTWACVRVGNPGTDWRNGRVRLISAVLAKGC